MDIHSTITTMFLDILTSFDLKHITFSTHMHGHRLDFLITRLTCNTISDEFLDHQGVIVDINMFKQLYLNKNFL